MCYNQTTNEIHLKIGYPLNFTFVSSFCDYSRFKMPFLEHKFRMRSRPGKIWERETKLSPAFLLRNWCAAKFKMRITPTPPNNKNVTVLEWFVFRIDGLIACLSENTSEAPVKKWSRIIMIRVYILFLGVIWAGISLKMVLRIEHKSFFWIKLVFTMDNVVIKIESGS